MVSIKQMNYKQEETDVKILANGFYKGFEYFILNLSGSHPTAYINIGFKEHIMFNEEWNDEDEVFFPVHGGITFHQKELRTRDKLLAFGEIIGWDYAHAGDKTRFDNYGKEYTTYEILLEVFHAIDYLITGRQ